jgi:hypothetical protein
MTSCTYANRKATAHPSQSKREVLFCRCLDCQDARQMNQGLRISLRKAVRERLTALQWRPPAPEPEEDDLVS